MLISAEDQSPPKAAVITARFAFKYTFPWFLTHWTCAAVMCSLTWTNLNTLSCFRPESYSFPPDGVLKVSSFGIYFSDADSNQLKWFQTMNKWLIWLIPHDLTLTVFSSWLYSTAGDARIFNLLTSIRFSCTLWIFFFFSLHHALLHPKRSLTQLFAAPTLPGTTEVMIIFVFCFFSQRKGSFCHQ